MSHSRSDDVKKKKNQHHDPSTENTAAAVLPSTLHDNNDMNPPPHPSPHPPNSKCDVCGYRDGHNTLVLIQCTDCKVFVHRDCYGMPTYNTNTTRFFQCWACQATGRSFDVNDVKTGIRMEIVQTERPRHCDLCGYNNYKSKSKKKSKKDNEAKEEEEEEEVHAMHPVYDNYGNKARQLYTTTGGAPRLVWAHTICGFFLATRQLMYATSKEGTTHEGEESDPEDDRSVNPELEEDDEDEDNDDNDEKDDPFQGFAPSHHFVWHRERPWTKLVQEHQLALTCDICHQSDYVSGSNGNSNSSKSDKRIFRIAVQCSANDKSEYPLFRSTHSTTLQDSESCTIAYHVGCARWGGGGGDGGHGKKATKSSEQETNKKNKKEGFLLRRVFYFPGLPNDETREPIRCIYCPVHARDVNAKERQQIVEQHEEQSQLARKKRKLALLQNQGLACLTLDQYNVHESTAEQQLVDEHDDNEEEKDNDNENENDENDGDATGKNQQEQLSLFFERMKRDLAAKVIFVTRENSKAFIKEQKKKWQRLLQVEVPLSNGNDDDSTTTTTFDQQWKEAKAHANQVWLEHQQQKEPEKKKGEPN